MNTTFTIIKQTARELAIPSLRHTAVPMKVYNSIQALIHVQLGYRHIKNLSLLKLTLKTSHIQPKAIFGGAALHFAAEYTPLEKGIRVMLAVKCIQDLRQHYTAFNQAFFALQDAVYDAYPRSLSPAWEKRQWLTCARCTPSLQVYLDQQTKKRQDQIKLITICALRLIWQIGLLSGCLADIYLLSQGDKDTQYTACTDLVANWRHYSARMRQDKAFLADELEKSGELADRIAQKMGLNLCAQSLVNTFRERISGAENVLVKRGEEAQATLATFYQPGKIQPLNVDGALPHPAMPLLEESAYPPWGGKKLEDPSPDDTLFTKLTSPVTSPIKAALHAIAIGKGQLNPKTLFVNQ